MGVTDNTWHHVCLMWDAESILLAVFKDGERKSESYGFWLTSGVEGNNMYCKLFLECYQVELQGNQRHCVLLVTVSRLSDTFPSPCQRQPVVNVCKFFSQLATEKVSKIE